MRNKSPTIISKRKSHEVTPFHGHVFSPASRAYFAWSAGQLDTGQLNQREAGKFFPSVNSGLQDHIVSTDVPNQLPPPDGKIASANQGNGTFMDEPGTHWQKHDVLSGDILEISWNYTAAHLTRRWNYFITRPNWNPDLPLSRAQFEDTPFYQVELSEQPFWENKTALTPPQPTEHDVILPMRSGYHVLLAVWEVADTGNAFYQVIDLKFVGEGSGGGNQVLPPRNVRVSSFTNKTVSLAWEASVSADISHYRIYRNGSFLIRSEALAFTDSGLQADTVFEYSVSTVNTVGNESEMSATVSIRTLPDHNTSNPPTSPSNLHSMGETYNSVSLMWGPSTTPNGLRSYLIHRNGVQIAEVPLSQLTFLDTGLLPDTQYSYFIIAQDNLELRSAPSNTLSVRTSSQSGGTYPQWELFGIYPVGARVSYRDRNWICLQAHTAWTDDWSPGGNDYETLWRVI